MTQYNKAFAALFIAALIAGFTAYQAVTGDGMTQQDWVTVILAALAPVAVYLSPKNTDPENGE